MKTPVGGSGGRQLVPGLLLMSDNHVATNKNNGFPAQHNPRVPPKGSNSVVFHFIECVFKKIIVYCNVLLSAARL